MNLNPENNSKETVKSQEPSLQEKVNDLNSDRGIPQDLSMRTKSNMGKVIILGIALLAMVFIIAGLMIFLKTGKKAKEVEQTVKVENVQNKNLENEKKDLLDSLPKPNIEDEQTADTSNTTTSDQTTTAQQSSEPQFTPYDRKKTGQVLVFAGDESDKREKNQNDSNQHEANQSDPLTGSSDPENRLSHSLNGTYFASTSAKQRADQTFLMNKGTVIPCVLITKIVTTYPGITKCQVTKDIYSADGKVLLLERGTTMIGEQQSALLQGQARVFALWTEAETPSGVVVRLDSPGTDHLGATGQLAKVNYHFWLRFGNAILLSLLDDTFDAVGNRLSKRKDDTINFQNSSDNAQDMASEALKNSINIPPTGYVNQGTLLNIMVARDVDFSHVYKTIHRSEAYSY